MIRHVSSDGNETCISITICKKMGRTVQTKDVIIETIRKKSLCVDDDLIHRNTP